MDKHKTPVTRAQVLEALAAIVSGKVRHIEVRDFLLIATIYKNPQHKLFEICQLRIADVQRGAGITLIFAYSGLPVAISNDLSELLCQLIASNAGQSQYIFTAIDKQGRFSKNCLSMKSVNRIIKGRLSAVGVEGPDISATSLRNMETERARRCLNG